MRVFLGTGTESNALRAGLGRLGPSAVGHGSEAGTGNDVTTTGNDHVTAGQVSNNTFNGFFTCLVVAVHCPCPCPREWLGCSRRDTIGRCRDRRRVCRRRLCIVWFLRPFLTVWC